MAEWLSQTALVRGFITNECAMKFVILFPLINICVFAFKWLAHYELKGP